MFEQKYDPLNEPADFSLLYNLSVLTGLKAPDGKNVYSILKLQGGSIGFALNMLHMLHRMDGKGFMDSILAEYHEEVGVNIRHLLESFYTDEEMENFKSFMFKITPEPRVHSFTVTGFDKGKPTELRLTMSAPSFDLMFTAFQMLSSDEYISAFMESISASE